MTHSRRHVPVKGRRGIYFSEGKSGKVYEVRYVDSKGQDRFKTTGPLLRDALDFQADIRVRLGKGERVVVVRMRLSELAKEWDAHRLDGSSSLTPGTVKSYRSHVRNHIIPGLGTRLVSEITADTIMHWVGGLKLSDSTKRSVYAVLSDILSFAASRRRGYITNNPCRDLEKGELPRAAEYPIRVLGPGEADLLLAASPLWLKQIVQTALMTGMRHSEILGLSWDDIDFEENVIHVRRQLQSGKRVPTKGKREREVPLLPSLRRILFGLPSRFNGGFVFVTSTGKTYHYSQVDQAFKKAREDAGLSEDPRALRLHDCRHTFASALLRDGRDVSWVSGLLGHTRTAVTLETYAHVIDRPGRVEEATERLVEGLGEWAR